MKRLAILTLLAVSALAALILIQTSSSNRGWTPDLKPGSIITLEEIERLEEKGWVLVRAEQVYRLYSFTAVYGRCGSTLLLVDGLKPTRWDPLMKPLLNPPVETLRLSSVANATVYYMPARLYYAHRAYCLEKIDETAYRVTGLIKHAYIGEGRGKPHRIIVRVSHEAFWETLVKVLNESLVSNPKLARDARVWRGERILELLGWKVVEKRVCGVTVVLNVPLVKASPIYYEAYELNPVYEKLILKPLIEKLLGGCGKRAEWWLDYSEEGSNIVDREDLLPPALLVYGGVCANWAYYSLLLARVFGLQDKLYIFDTGYHQAAVLCTDNPIRFPAVHGGTPGCYGLLAVDRRHNKSLICWLWDDTGYAALNWWKVRGTVYNNEDPGYYIVVKTWTGCRIPSDVLNTTRAG